MNERQLGDELQSYRINNIRPDGYGAWRQAGHAVEFFIEHDRGTESLSRLQDKLRHYRPLIDQIGRPVIVLFTLRTSARLLNVLEALADVAVENAISVAFTASGSIAGSHADWRIPTETSVKSLVELGRE